MTPLPIGARVDATAYEGDHGTITANDDVSGGVTWYRVRLDRGGSTLLDASRFIVLKVPA